MVCQERSPSSCLLRPPFVWEVIIGQFCFLWLHNEALSVTCNVPFILKWVWFAWVTVGCLITMEFANFCFVGFDV